MKQSKFLKVAAAACMLSASFGANSADILFAHANSSASYVADGNQLANMLTSAGHSVTTRYLNQAVYNDYSSFDQVFVYDLSHSASDLTSTHMANYANIANWYNSLTNQNLILDGRIISSATNWTNANSMTPEDAWIQNYAEQLNLRGGGLVLGTDHDVFQTGINEINKLIGVTEFWGSYGSYPGSQAVVDGNSSLAIATLDNCRNDPTYKCINDNSSTGFVATGLQANGQMLTPVAYHGLAIDAWDQAAVSATFGSETFGTCGGEGQPPCHVDAATTLPLLGLGLLGVAAMRRRVI